MFLHVFVAKVVIHMQRELPVTTEGDSLCSSSFLERSLKQKAEYPGILRLFGVQEDLLKLLPIKKSRQLMQQMAKKSNQWEFMVLMLR